MGQSGPGPFSFKTLGDYFSLLWGLGRGPRYPHLFEENNIKIVCALKKIINGFICLGIILIFLKKDTDRYSCNRDMEFEEYDIIIAT